MTTKEEVYNAFAHYYNNRSITEPEVDQVLSEYCNDINLSGRQVVLTVKEVAVLDSLLNVAQGDWFDEPPFPKGVKNSSEAKSIVNKLIKKISYI